MKHSFFHKKFTPDVPYAGTPNAPSITTGVLSITADPAFGARRDTYHFWVTDTSSLDASISHFRQNGWTDSTFTKYSSRSLWNRSYPDSILRSDSLPIMSTPPHLRLIQPQRLRRLPLVPLRLRSHPLSMRRMRQARLPTRSPHSRSTNLHHSKIPPLRTSTLPLRSYLPGRRRHNNLLNSTNKN